MKKKASKFIQGVLKNIAQNAVGKSIPYTLYERKIPEEIFNIIKNNF